MALTLDGNGTMTVGNGDITGITRGAIESTAIGTGAVLQVVSTTKTDTFSTASTSFVDLTGLSVSITPTSTSSKIWVTVDTNYGPSSLSGLSVFNLVRDSTNISQPATSVTFTGTAVAYLSVGDTCMPFGFNFLDSPATTSSTTYKVQVKMNSGTMYVNRRGSTDTVSTSSITVMEIAA